MSGPESVEGLITRIGRWLDRRFRAKATQEELRYYWNQLENAAIKDKIEIMDKIEEVKTQASGVWTDCMGLVAIARKDQESDFRKVSERIDLLRTPDALEKEVADLKTRLEKIELYSGMTRKVDPTKPSVVKSAFQM